MLMNTAITTLHCLGHCTASGSAFSEASSMQATHTAEMMHGASVKKRMDATTSPRASVNHPVVAAASKSPPNTHVETTTGHARSQPSAGPPCSMARLCVLNPP